MSFNIWKKTFRVNIYESREDIQDVVCVVVFDISLGLARQDMLWKHLYMHNNFVLNVCTLLLNITLLYHTHKSSGFSDFCSIFLLHINYGIETLSSNIWNNKKNLIKCVFHGIQRSTRVDRQHTKQIYANNLFTVSVFRYFFLFSSLFSATVDQQHSN